QGAHAGRRARGKNGDGVDEALVQNAEHDIDRDQRGQDEQSLIGEGVVEGSRRTLEVRLQTGGEMHLRGDLFDVGDGRSQGGVGSQVEGHCYGRKLTLVINGQRLGGGGGLGERVEWNGACAGAGGGRVGGCARDGAPID